jgi:PPP family 3-phenylpropionic acid transporter
LVAINSTYATLYTVDGALLPFLSVFLAYAHGLPPSRIGFVLAASSVASIVAPPIASLLADRYGRPKALFLVLLAASAVTLFVLTNVEGYWWVLVVYAAFSLVREPTRPLLDGIFFAAQRTYSTLAMVSYHRVRIWGTFGYMLPGVALYFLLRSDSQIRLVPLLACVLAVLSLVVALRLPSGERPEAADPAGTAADSPGSARTARVDLPALLRATSELLRQPSTLVFLGGMFLLQVSMSAYFAFYPLLATDVVGLAPRWIGLVTNLGVGLELGYMAAFGVLVRWFGWRWLTVLGAVGMGVRVVLLAAVPTLGVLVGTQVLHGLVIVVSMVAGRVILDRRAPDEIRHTTQGLYAMLVVGCGRIVGSALAGVIASHSLAAVFWSAALAAGVAALGLAWALRS